MAGAVVVAPVVGGGGLARKVGAGVGVEGLGGGLKEGAGKGRKEAERQGEGDGHPGCLLVIKHL